MPSSPSGFPDPPGLHVASASAGLLGFLGTTFLWSASAHVAAFDQHLLQTLAAPSGSLAETTARIVTLWGSVPVLVGLALLIAAWLWRRGARRAALAWGALFAAGEATVFGLKLLVSRARPTAPGLLQASFSYPSGHAFGALLVYGMGLCVLFRARPDWAGAPLVGAVALLVAAIGASRVVLAVHHPTDVLGGWMWAVPWLALATWSVRLEAP